MLSSWENSRNFDWENIPMASSSQTVDITRRSLTMEIHHGFLPGPTLKAILQGCRIPPIQVRRYWPAKMPKTIQFPRYGIHGDLWRSPWKSEKLRWKPRNRCRNSLVFFDFLMLLVLKFWMSKKPELHHTGPPWNPPVFFGRQASSFARLRSPWVAKKTAAAEPFILYWAPWIWPSGDIKIAIEHG